MQQESLVPLLSLPEQFPPTQLAEELEPRMDVLGVCLSDRRRGSLGGMDVLVGDDSVTVGGRR